MSAAVALMDRRVRPKDLWIIGLPLAYIAFNIAGAFAGIACSKL